MKRRRLVIAFCAAMATPQFGLQPLLPTFVGIASAQELDPEAKEAFEATKALGTVEAWRAFLARYKTGFYADLGQAYLRKLTAARTSTAPVAEDAASAPDAAPPPAPQPDAAPSPASEPTAPAPVLTPEPAASASRPETEAAAPAESDERGAPPTSPTAAAVARGGRYMGFEERFNRYYTDPDWKPSATIYVSPNGKGDGSSSAKPTAVQTALAAAKPGTLIHFNRGAYSGCLELTKEQSGTYDEPIVLYGERKDDKSIGVILKPCATGRQTGVNLEAADYVAVDGFEIVGGRFGVRAVGAGYPASEHARGVAVLNCDAHDQNNDAFFSGQTDWTVWERIRGHGAGPGDGHGLYISNGSDWNIVRFIETFNDPRSDFQVNAGPLDTCKEVGIPFDDPRCDAYAGEGEGGQGASDYLLIDSNYFHHNSGPGVNFTSVRRSLIRNNVFGFNARHNVSFWQETDNPKLGSRENKILHNLFVSTGRHGVQFIQNSTQNQFANNVVIGIQPKGAAANPKAVLLGVDETVGENVYADNFFASGRLEGYTPNDRDTVVKDFSSDWFAKFPSALNRNPDDFRPATGAPFLGKGELLPDALADRNGVLRKAPVDLGPIAASGDTAAGDTAAGDPAAGATAASDPAAGDPATAEPVAGAEPTEPAAAETPDETPAPAKPGPAAPAAPQAPAAKGRSSSAQPAAAGSRAVTVARATTIPACTIFVDAASAGQGSGAAQKPYKTITAAVAAAKPAAVICVAEGVYAEQIKPGEKPFTLAGGFQRGKEFKVRDSAAYVSKAQGRGGSFIRIDDPAPSGKALTAIDGFEITGYSQAIVRDFSESQRFEVTNNHIHDNICADQKLAGAAFALNNISGAIVGNVIRKNECGRGGGGSLYDDSNKNTVLVAGNLVDDNAGTEPDASHGGGFYLFANKLTVTENLFTNNRVTQWGAGLYVGAWTAGGNFTNAKMSWNVYRGNKAGNSGGGFFCDDAAACASEHEVYVGNCGGNILLDGGEDNSAPNVASFDHITNVGALEPDCASPGVGVLITKGTLPSATYTFTNALFWQNAPGKDFATYCDKSCGNAKITVSHSMVQTEHAKQNMSAKFGPGVMAPADPLFADVANGDFHLRSKAGRWTPDGPASDPETSPALGKGNGAADKNPERAGKINELGSYGNSPEASYIQ